MPQNTPQQDSPQETTRRVENLARMGTVTAVQLTKPARCRVKLGDNTTDWLPWMAGRAAGNKGSQWWPPVVGEQCMVIAPGGDLAQGVVLLGAYSSSMDAPSDEAGVQRTQWSDNDFQQYSESQHTTHTEQAIVFEVGQGCRITLLPDSIQLVAGAATLQIGPNNITSSVDVLAQGISAVHHVHPGVRTGDSSTQEPTS